MCGITGFLATNGPAPAEERKGTLRRMTRALAHRGPDASGVWQGLEGRINLGHTRLSIVDLSPTGAQPMVSSDGRFVLVFNGEIYNFQELRLQLEGQGVRFRGTSDTEVLIEALSEWGPIPALRRLNGMFAFALWDQQERTLTLARDRFGEKPVYYSWIGEDFVFGSELKALMIYPGFRRDVATSALTDLVSSGYVKAPTTIFVGCSKLSGGHLIQVTPGAPRAAPRPYWQHSEMLVGRGRAGPFDEHEALEELDVRLRRAVGRRMVADVPVGAFLSGGIDSSAVVALMQLQSSRAVNTFTIGFWETDYNEAGDAARVARHLQTDHHEVYLTSRECIDTIQRLPEIFDEPFADSSQIPTTLVAEYTRRHVTVALSGDGGDEFFGGYNRYVWANRLWHRFRQLPRKLRLLGRDLILNVSAQSWEQVVDTMNLVVPSRFRVRGGGDKIHKIARILDAQDLDGVYRELVSNPQWANAALSRYSASEPHFETRGLSTKELTGIERMMFIDQLTYMTDDILCKVDRSTMSMGLEARVPFLDNDLTEFAWSLPMDFKIRHGVGKWPLRQVLKRYVPSELFERPKAGFGIPVGAWLRGPMRDWAEDLLSEASLAEGGWFNVEAVRGNWAEHLAGRRNMVHQLWSVLMFLAWKRKWIDRR